MKFWRWLVSPADAEDKEEAIQEEWMNIIAEPDEATRRSWYEVRRKAGLANPIIKPHWEIKPLLRIASMILIPLFSVLLSWYYINDYTDSCKLVEYIVPMGERGELTLPDGTKVQINSESSIIYPKAFEAIHVLFIFPERRILMSIRIRNIRLLSRHLCYQFVL